MIKYIFSINPGRAGSNYLSNVLNHIEGVVAVHESEPIMNGRIMRAFLKGHKSLLEEKMPEKIKQIKSAVSNNEIYVETNHCFIKGFGWYLVNEIPNNEIGVILIKRDNSQVTNSLFTIGCSPLVKMGKKWIMTPSMKNPVNKISASEKLLYPVYSLIGKVFRSNLNTNFLKFKLPGFIEHYERKMISWYVKETYSQGERFMQLYPDIKVFETQTDQLNNMNELQKMFSFFNLPFKPKPSLREVLGVATNKKVLQKSKQL